MEILRARYESESARVRGRMGRPSSLVLHTEPDPSLMASVDEALHNDSVTLEETTRRMRRMQLERYDRSTNASERAAIRYTVKLPQRWDALRADAARLWADAAEPTQAMKAAAARDLRALQRDILAVGEDPNWREDCAKLVRILDKIAVFAQRHEQATAMTTAQFRVSAEDLNEIFEVRNTCEAEYGRHVHAQMREVVSSFGTALPNSSDIRAHRAYDAFQKALVHFDIQPSLDHWQHLQNTASETRNYKLLASEESTMQLGSASHILDSATKAFAVRLHRVRTFEERQEARVREADAATLALLQEEARRREAAGILRSDGRPNGVKPPIRRAKGKRGSGAAARSIAASVAESPAVIAEEADPVDARIAELLESARAGMRFEGEVASYIRENLAAFVDVLATNVRFRRNNRDVAEIDILLDHAIVECTLRDSGKNKQLQSRLTNPVVNPLRLPVILYAENYAAQHVSSLPQGVYFARNREQLTDILFALKMQQRRS